MRELAIHPVTPDRWSDMVQLFEHYPVRSPSVDPYTGYDTMFEAAGFRLLKPGRGRGRALWRRDLKRR